MKYRLMALLLALVFACTPISALAADTLPAYGNRIRPPAPPVPSCLGLDANRSLLDRDALDLDGAAILLYERTTGTMVYAKNIDTPREPASVTKLMTCLLALENCALTEQVPVTEEALTGLDPDGSTAGLQAGEVYTMEELLYCLMVQSANDAAQVIAAYVGGSQSYFAAMMNLRAWQLGCTGTRFLNPHGLHQEGHVTTARDLAKILDACLEYSFFLTLISTEKYVLPASGTHEERTLLTTDYLISGALTKDYLDSRVWGGKTGYTTPAGRCIACTAYQEDLIYLAVVLGASGEDGQGNPLYGSFTTVSALLDAGFGDVTAVSAAYSFPALESGQTLATDGPVQVLLPSDYDETSLEAAAAELPEQGRTARITYQGKLVGTAPLYPEKAA